MEGAIRRTRSHGGTAFAKPRLLHAYTSTTLHASPAGIEHVLTSRIRSLTSLTFFETPHYAFMFHYHSNAFQFLIYTLRYNTTNLKLKRFFPSALHLPVLRTLQYMRFPLCTAPIYAAPTRKAFEPFFFLQRICLKLIRFLYTSCK